MGLVGKIVVIGCSYGCIDALLKLLPQFDRLWLATYFITLHTGPRSILPEVLQRNCALRVKHAEQDEIIALQTVYVARPDCHLYIGQTALSLIRGPRENWCRPAIDPMFRSAALAHGRRVIGVLMTGLLNDGANGIAMVHRCGGQTIVQDPDDAVAPGIPEAALERISPDYVVPMHEIGSVLEFCIEGDSQKATG